MLFVLAMSCGRDGKKHSNEGGEESEKPQVGLTSPNTECLVEMKFEKDGIWDQDETLFVQHAIYGVEKVEEACRNFVGRDAKELKFGVRITSKPVDGYLYQILINDSLTRFMPGVAMKDGDAIAEDIGSADWKGSIPRFDSVVMMFGFNKRVEKSNYLQKVILVVSAR